MRRSRHVKQHLDLLPKLPIRLKHVSGGGGRDLDSGTEDKYEMVERYVTRERWIDSLLNWRLESISGSNELNLFG